MTASLLDRIIRHQVYLEGFKAGVSATFRDTYLQSVDLELRRALATVKVDRLDELTKAQLNVLMALLTGILAKAFNRYAREILKFLRKFMDGERTLLGSLISGSPEAGATPLYGPLASLGTRPGRDRLWTAIEHAPLPGIGTFLGDTLTVFVANAEAKILQLVRASTANGLTGAETIAALVGGPSTLFGNSLLTKFDYQNETLIATIIQHISSMVEVAAASALFAGYTWVSVVDFGTTEICHERNGNYYLFADGPLPPAHYRCRSMTVPGHAEPPASFPAWLLTQPPELIRDMMSTRDAVDSIRHPHPLSLDDYLAKLDNMLV